MHRCSINGNLKFQLSRQGSIQSERDCNLGLGSSGTTYIGDLSSCSFEGHFGGHSVALQVLRKDFQNATLAAIILVQRSIL